MSEQIQNALSLFLRWSHLIAAISWIGSSFYFIWLDKALTQPDEAKPDVEGEVWLVHSGGFYQVERRRIGPGRMPKTLHWFKWEAAFTWITGVLLLGVVYFAGEGVLLLDPTVSSLSFSNAVILVLAILPVSWLVYDFLCRSPLSKSSLLSNFVFLSLLTALSYGLCHALSGRAAFILFAGILGTLMVANVWMRILPAQSQMIRATEEGRQPDFSLSSQAKFRSVHNSYMTLGVLALMISNHYPITYGNEHNWVVLLCLMVLGAAGRHIMIQQKKAGALPWILGAGVLAILAILTSGGCEGSKETPQKEVAPVTAAVTETDPQAVGTLKGQVSFTGTAPAPKKIAVTAECRSAGSANLMVEPVKVKAGKLANAFVWIESGLEGKKFPVPTESVVIDQKGCDYQPHVIGVQVGQEFTYLNSDTFLHNVHTQSQGNPSFNLSLATKNQTLKRKFTKPEVMIHTKCDLHPWMSAYIGVVGHPFYAVTGDSGEFLLKDLPAGHYTLQVWHETLGIKKIEVDLGAKETKEVAFQFP